MMDINTLASKVGGEFVGGRLLATIDGKKQYLTLVGSDGKSILTEVGLKVSNELSLAEPEPTALRRPRAKKAAAVDTDELLENFELDV
jgi:hypothetical protein